jgi:enterochelin esterase-like enzyme
MEFKQVCSFMGLGAFILGWVPWAPQNPANQPTPDPSRTPKAGVRHSIMPGAQSPEVHQDGTVTFRLRAPSANSVHISSQGDSPGFDAEMTRDVDGVWKFTSPPLSPDVYNYYFTIDGVVIADPANTQVRFQHYGETIGVSTVEVPGSPPNPWDVQPVPHGSVVHSQYASKAAKAEHDYYVYLPPGYDPMRKQAYPVIYLLHGLTENASAWFTVGKANVMVDNYIAQGKMKPVVMVATLGYDDVNNVKLLTTDKSEQLHNLAVVTDALLSEVMPRVERDYNISREQKNRTIAGLSMGGAQALSIGLAHPETFAYVGAFSPAFFLLDDNLAKAFPGVDPKINSRYKLIYFSCGVDDYLYGGSLKFKNYLENNGVKFEFLKMDGRHAWPVFRRSFAGYVLKIFN